MGKRILLFVVTNLAIVFMLTIVLQILGISGLVRVGGRLDLGSLMVFSLIWGMGVKVINGPTGAPELDWYYRTVQRLAQQAQLPMPEVGVYDSPEVNAFATGPSRSRSLVAVSTGLLRTMRQEETEGVLAHELAHIKNGDMVTMTLIQGVVNAFVIFLARLIGSLVRGSDSRNGQALSFIVTMVLQVVLGILGMIVVAWYSRAREFRADAGGAALAGRGNMISALRRLQSTHELVDNSQPQLATLKISGGGAMLLFSTHPPLEARIKALESLRG